MKLLIRNLDRSITEDELKKLFGGHGAVQSCDVVLDKATGESKGFAFVEMPKRKEASSAIKALNGKTVANKIIRVKKAID